MLSRAGRAAMFDRKAFTEAYFDSDAMADSAIIVAGVGAITYVGALLSHGALAFFQITGLFQVLIASVTSWLILGFATWFAATRLFGSSGRPQTLIAMQGLAVLPLLLEIVGDRAAGFGLGDLAAAVGLVWYLVILVVATREGAEISTRYAAVSVLIGFAAAVLIRLLLRVPFAVFGALV